MAYNSVNAKMQQPTEENFLFKTLAEVFENVYDGEEKEQMKDDLKHIIANEERRDRKEIYEVS